MQVCAYFYIAHHPRIRYYLRKDLGSVTTLHPVGLRQSHEAYSGVSYSRDRVSVWGDGSSVCRWA